MKLSEFYEKYWKVNGQSPQPLRRFEREQLDDPKLGNHVSMKENIAEYKRMLLDEKTEDADFEVIEPLRLPNSNPTATNGASQG